MRNNSIFKCCLKANEVFYNHKNNSEYNVKEKLVENVEGLCMEHPTLIEDAKLYSGTGVYGNLDSEIISMKVPVQTQVLGR